MKTTFAFFLRLSYRSMIRPLTVQEVLALLQRGRGAPDVRPRALLRGDGRRLRLPGKCELWRQAGEGSSCTVKNVLYASPNPPRTQASRL